MTIFLIIAGLFYLAFGLGIYGGLRGDPDEPFTGASILVGLFWPLVLTFAAGLWLAK